MKIDYKALQRKFLPALEDKPTNALDVINAMKKCCEDIKRGQKIRESNPDGTGGTTLGESWGIDTLEKIIDCFLL